METLFNGYTLQIAEGSFPLSTDSMVLADFVKLPAHAKVLDLGSGCGTLGVLLCAKDSACIVTGLEISEAAHRAAEENIARNHLESRLSSICGDITRVPQFITPGSFTTAVSNPPYFTGGPESQLVPDARKETRCSLEDLFRSAAWALKYGGDFFLVHRPERLAEICTAATEHQLIPKRLLLVRHRLSQPISLVLLQCRKGGKHGLKLEELTLFDENNHPTDAYRRIYHLQEE